MCNSGVFVVILALDAESFLDVDKFCSRVGKMNKLKKGNVQAVLKECAKGKGGGDGGEEVRAAEDLEVPSPERAARNPTVGAIARKFVSSMLALFWKSGGSGDKGRSKRRIEPVITG